MTAKLITAVDCCYQSGTAGGGVGGGRGAEKYHETTFALIEISVAGSLAGRQRVRGFCRPFCLELVSNDRHRAHRHARRFGRITFYFPLIARTALGKRASKIKREDNVARRRLFRFVSASTVIIMKTRAISFEPVESSQTRNAPRSTVYSFRAGKRVAPPKYQRPVHRCPTKQFRSRTRVVKMYTRTASG